MEANGADVIIVGGGPAGLFLACRLTRMQLRVIVLEKDADPVPAVRAIGYYAATQYALQKAGLFEEARRKGHMQLEGFSWRKTTKQISPDERAWGDLIAAWNPWDDTSIEPGACGRGMLTLGQDKLRELCLQQLATTEYAQVYLGYPVTDLRQDDDAVTVITNDPSGGQRRFTATFAVGADGGGSTTRKLIGQSLEGFSWPHYAVGVDLLVNLPPPSDGPRLVYLLDKENMGFFCPLEEPKADAPILYRFTFPLKPEECQPEVFDAHVRRKVELYVPGKRPLDYQIVRAGKYAIHQRQVADYLVGRTMLIGDAAHLNSPTGGLALTTGLLDADSLADALELVIHAKEPFDILRLWADARHSVWKDVTNPMSQKNTNRIVHTDPENPKGDPFLKMIIEGDERVKELNDQFNKALITDVRELLGRNSSPVHRVTPTAAL